MDPRRPVPPEMLELAYDFARGERRPVQTRDASTVVLMRPSVDGPQVYLLQRHLDMVFASGMTVFPGGGVDRRDFDGDIGWGGPTVAQWAEKLACDHARARALVCAAVRETFEESGVLLAGPTPDSVIADTSGDDWESDRLALERHDLSFSEFLGRRGLVVRTDLLRLWSRWVTPVFEPKRYDTRIFVAALPSGQATRDVSTESAEVMWMLASDAVTAVDRRQLRMLPPTYCTCMEVAEQPDPDAVLAAADLRDLAPIEPELVLDAANSYLELPARLVDLGMRASAS